jgi:organic hydroperoxide reductase OsmC/OhrA
VKVVLGLQFDTRHSTELFIPEQDQGNHHAYRKAVFTAQATSTGGRTGTTKSSDGEINLSLAKAYAMCPYSNATRGNIDVTLTVV